MGKFNRECIRKRLDEKINKKQPIVIGTAGAGIVAKAEEYAGIDLIQCYSTGFAQIAGVSVLTSYLPYYDVNGMTREIGSTQILRVVKNTPVIAGVGAGDPYRDIHRWVNEMIDIGFSGIINVPTLSTYKSMKEGLDMQGAGRQTEVDMFKHCIENNIFCAAYVYNEEEARELAALGVDIITIQSGMTVGGLMSMPEQNDIEKSCEIARKYYEIIMKENPNVYVLVHGGAFSNPDGAKIGLLNTPVHGIAGSSAINRIPIENAVMEIVKKFRNLKLMEKK